MIALLIAGLLLLVLIEYSMCVVSHDADERADEMYRRWKDDVEANKGRTDRTCGDEVVE